MLIIVIQLRILNSFFRSSYTLTIHESAPPNTIVYVLNTDSITSIRYSFRDPCPFLSVHPISGVISTKLVTNVASVPHTCIAVARNSLGTEDFMELKINVSVSYNCCGLPIIFFSLLSHRAYLQKLEDHNRKERNYEKQLIIQKIEEIKRIQIKGNDYFYKERTNRSSV